MRTDWTEINKYRVTAGRLASTDNDGRNGAFSIIRGTASLMVIASDGFDGNGFIEWEHVSVHAREHKGMRVPTWEEMCWIKNLFFGPEEVVVQFHPRKSDYVNHHPYTLHLWRWTRGEFPCPPKDLVGPS